MNTTKFLFFVSVILFFTNSFASDVKPTNDNIEYIKGMTDDSKELLFEAANKYKNGDITKEQFLIVLEQVNKGVNYFKNIDTPPSTTTNIVADIEKTPIEKIATVNDNKKILIGTANNGNDKIYSITQKSWDNKHGHKVQIVSGDPTINPYDLTVPHSNNGNEVINILQGIPSEFKVDKNVSGTPIVKVDKGTRGLWRATSDSLICIHEPRVIAQPAGECKIGDKFISSGGGFANDLVPSQKACIDRGFEKFEMAYNYECIPDIYANNGGM